MKNFYEVTVIDIENQLEVAVELREHDNPEYKFTVNDLPMVSRMPFAFCLLAELQFRCKCCPYISILLDLQPIGSLLIGNLQFLLHFIPGIMK